MTKFEKFIDDGGTLVVVILGCIGLGLLGLYGGPFIATLVCSIITAVIFELWFKSRLSKKYPILMENRRRHWILKTEIEKNPTTSFNTLCVRAINEETE